MGIIHHLSPDDRREHLRFERDGESPAPFRPTQTYGRKQS
jgi:hypothetical protein